MIKSPLAHLPKEIKHMNEQDYKDIMAAIELLAGIVGRENTTQRAREEIKKNFNSTGTCYISRR